MSEMFFQDFLWMPPQMLTSMKITIQESKGRQEIRKRRRRMEITEIRTPKRILGVKHQNKILVWIQEWIGEITNLSPLLAG